MTKPTYVVSPNRPDIETFITYIKDIWKTGNFTSGPKGAPLVNQLERKLAEFLNVPECVLVANGTVALELALQSLDIEKGDIITSPFTYLATVNAIENSGFNVKFCDIESDYFGLDPSQLEKIITPHTAAILPVHSFGQPCRIQDIESIANHHNIPTIFDAAHCFGSQYNGISALQYGTFSTLSFQATKIFQTGEGGAIITQNPDLANKLRKMRIFGLNPAGEIEVPSGMNGKMSEINAALGLSLIEKMPVYLDNRKKQYLRYREMLGSNNHLQFQKISIEESNCSYFAILFSSQSQQSKVALALEEEKIFPRRYFHPSLDTIRNIGTTCPTSRDISQRILCLPLHEEVTESLQDKICNIILQTV